MKTFNYNVTRLSISNLVKPDDFFQIISSKSILIQVFSGENIQKIKVVIKEIKELFKDALIIGSTTDGEILDTKVTTQNTVVSISTFSNTTFKSICFSINNSFEDGKKVAKELIVEDSVAIISFGDGLNLNGEEYLNGINFIDSDILVSGGLSGDNGEFKNCYIIYDDKIYENHIVAVSLNSNKLNVRSMHRFGWDKIGIKHTVTKAKQNRIYTIDNITAVDFYEKYLGTEIAKNLPSVGVEFPLIKMITNIDVARAVVKKYDDGSLGLAGNIEEGEDIYLGIGNHNKILSENFEYNNLQVESFFIYSCMARRRFLGDKIVDEIYPFSSVTDTTGFFTYGEFFHKEQNQLLNETFTILALSESDEVVKINKQSSNIYADKSKTYQALSNIIQQTTSEYNKLNNKLENKYIQKTLDVLDLNNQMMILMENMHEGMFFCKKDGTIISTNKMICKLLKYDKNECISKNISDIIHFKDKDLNITEKFETDFKMQEQLIIKSGDIIDVIINFSELSSQDNIYMIAIIDITDIKSKDKQLMMQAKHAQMGEMINMIAHQWRQPLNAITANAINLGMKNSFGCLEENDIEESTEYIQDMCHKMSKTISDFMNLSKPDNKSEKVFLKEIYDNMLSFMKSQLIQHNITIEFTGDLGIELDVIKQDLMHIIINIVTNAKDALDELDKKDKNVIINSFIENNRCIIEIKDNAGGIKIDEIEKIFNPYYTTKVEGMGTGIGLYMCKKLLDETLNGTISVSNDSNGAIFKIELPK